MRGSRYRDRQAAGHRDTPVESEQFQRDLTLIVVHRDDAVVVPARGCNEKRIGRPWTGRVQAIAPEAIHCRRNRRDLLGSEKSSLSRVRVQRCDSDPRRGDTTLYKSPCSKWATEQI